INLRSGQVICRLHIASDLTNTGIFTTPKHTPLLVSQSISFSMLAGYRMHLSKNGMKSVLHLDVSSLKINHESFLHLLIIFMSQFSPGFFRSLLSSCYDAGFYSQIKNISLKRSFGFLFLFSILVSIVSFLLLLSYFSREEEISQNFLDVYDSHVPAFEVMIRENTLEIPSPITLYFQVDQHRNVSLETSSSSSSFFLLQADTS